MGRVLDALDQPGLTENTLVVFAADNGCAPYIGVEEMNEQGHYPSYIYRGYKSDIWEGGHRALEAGADTELGWLRQPERRGGAPAQSAAYPAL